MLVWLLVLLLLIIFIYAVYRIVYIPTKEDVDNKKEQHYTFKI